MVPLGVFSEVSGGVFGYNGGRAERSRIVLWISPCVVVNKSSGEIDIIFLSSRSYIPKTSLNH